MKRLIIAYIILVIGSATLFASGLVSMPAKMKRRVVLGGDGKYTDPYSNNWVVAYFHETLATKLTDSSTNNNHGVFCGEGLDPVWTNVYGGCLYFCTNDCFKATTESAFDFGTNNFTISAWVKITVEANSYFVSKMILASANGLKSFFGVSDKVVWMLTSWIGPGYVVSDANIPASWTHLVFVKLNDLALMYVNGVCQTNTVNAADSDLNNDEDFIFGVPSGSSDHTSPGFYGEERVYDIGLSSNSVLNLYNGTKWQYD